MNPQELLQEIANDDTRREFGGERSDMKETYFERRHRQASELLGSIAVDELRHDQKESSPVNPETKALWLATWPLCSGERLVALVREAMRGQLSWEVGALAMQHPKLPPYWLMLFMRRGLEYVAFYGNRHGSLQWQPTSIHWLYGAGLKNPLLGRLDWDHPGKLADFMSEVRKPKQKRAA